MALTELACKNAKGKDKPYKLADAGGLYLYVSTTGARFWRFDFTFQKKRKTLSFGSYPEVMLLQARVRRDSAKIILKDGLDPSQFMEDGAAPNAEMAKTFAFAAHEWFGTRKAEWSKGHAERLWSQLERDILSEIGTQPITTLTAPDILAAVRKVEDRGALDTARRVKQNIAGIFDFAIAEGWAKVNPALSITKALKKKPRVQHRAKLSAQEIPEFFESLVKYDGEPQTALGLELVFHTFVRTKEIRFAKWSEFESDLWRIPADRMKMHREHLVPLTPHVVGLLAKLKAISNGSPYVLTSPVAKKKSQPVSENTLLYALYRMGFHSRATVHGLRGTASTILNESGLFNEDWIEMQLAHDEEDEVRAAYNSAEYLGQRRDMMLWWSNYLISKAPEPYDELDDLLRLEPEPYDELDDLLKK